MRFVTPNAAGSDKVRSGSSVHYRPDWLKEWIANKGKYVRLTCGHRLDLKARDVLLDVTHVNGAERVWCYRCSEVFNIEKSIGVYEFHYGKPAPPIPDEPLF